MQFKKLTLVGLITRVMHPIQKTSIGQFNTQDNASNLKSCLNSFNTHGNATKLKAFLSRLTLKTSWSSFKNLP